MYYYKLLILIILVLLNNTILNIGKTKNININKIFKKNIYIKNNLFVIKINKKNSNIKSLNILKYNKKINFKNKKNNYNIISKIKIKEKKNKFKKIKFKIDKIIIKNNYIKLIFKKKKNNIKYIKKIKIYKNFYYIKYNYIIYNKSKYKHFFYIKKKIIKNINIKKKKNKYIFISYSNIENNNNINKFNINNINKKINKIEKANWICIFEKYYLISWITNNTRYKNIIINKKNNNYYIKYNKKYLLKKNKNINIKFKLLISPKFNNYLNKISKNLDLTIDYGIFSFITKILLKIIFKINSITKNLGYSIIILTILIKIITYPLSKIQYIYFLKINKLYYKINKIKKKYINKKNKLNKKITNLYKKNNIYSIFNTLITIIQIPIFISIYNILTIPIEFKKKKFIFWINDLSKNDKYYLLPFITSISLYLIYINNNNNKNYLNIIISILFGIFLINLPSGLLIHYIFNNIITFIQQKIILTTLVKKNGI